ncbi:MAG: hypothetical protein IIX61_04970 [Loktanella sp.]|nr:hypothetical protein [Loktanella sp.]
MRISSVIATAAAVATLSTAAVAGGMSPEIMEAPVAVAPAPAGSSINPAFVVVGVLAALLIASASSSSSSNDDAADVVDGHDNGSS